MAVRSVLDDGATRTLEGIGAHLWGFRPRLMRQIVTDRGAFGSLAWFVANMPGYERTLATEGAVRTHLWCLALSIDNRCAYCTFGHGLALELVFLREHDSLFPIDETDLVALTTQERDRQRESLVSAIVASGLDVQLGSVERLWDLKGGAEPVSTTDRRMTRLIKMFAMLNACGRDGCVLPDEAHDPVNKDAALKERYRQLRAEAAAGGS